MADDLLDLRKEKIQSIRDSGIDPYPYRYDVSHSCHDVQTGFDQLAADGSSVSVAGRIMLLRHMGKAAFATIQDSSDRLQLYLRTDVMGKEAFKQFKKILDIGDIVGARGAVFKTKTGEITVEVRELTLLTKSLRALPEKYHGLVDKEIRYRQRELDMIMDPAVMKTFQTRSAVIAAVRRFMDKHNFVEVETPTIQAVYGGGEARPFITHINALDVDAYLSISPELYLKRFVIGGMERVFTLCKNFRNEGIDRTHNPEFTMMECYRAYADYNDVMDFTEALFESVLTETLGTTKITWQGHELDFSRPWPRVPIYTAVSEAAGVDFKPMTRDQVLAWIDTQQFDEPVDPNLSKGYLLVELFDRLVEADTIQPTFITDYPAETSPLCKLHRDDPELIERFELFIAGCEMANAYSELNDPVRQRELLEGQASKLRAGLEQGTPMDEEFAQAIETGMPPTGGLGIGIDRMVMLATDQTSIRDVVAFPFMKPTGSTGIEFQPVESLRVAAADAAPVRDEEVAEPSSEAPSGDESDPAFGIGAERAYALFEQMITSENLQKHCIASAAIMKSLAHRFGKNTEAWELAGLLHDLDFDRETTPETHGLETVSILNNEGVHPYYVSAIKRHNEALGEPRETVMDHALAAAESISGLIAAAALILPSKKLAELKPKSVIKRMKKKDFARNVSRETIMECETIDIPLEEFAALAVEAMQGVSDQLGL